MNINKKLEEIRQQPRHVRIKYVWLSVSVSMIVVFLIWVFSIQSSFKGNDSLKETSLPNLKKQLQDTKTEAPSISDFSQNIPQDSSAEGISASEAQATDATLEDNSGTNSTAQ